MRRWIAAIIFGSLGRLFNNPNTVYKLEDRLANSGPIRQLARYIVALYQRGSWELKQLKSIPPRPHQIGANYPPPPPLGTESLEELMRRIKKFEDELKRKMEKKM